MEKQGGVLNMESFSAWVLYLSMVGTCAGTRSSRSSRMMTTVTPAGPMFFWAPAKISPKRLTSTGRLRMSELMSAMSRASLFGMAGYWVP